MLSGGLFTSLAACLAPDIQLLGVHISTCWLPSLVDGLELAIFVSLGLTQLTTMLVGINRARLAASQTPT